MNADHRWQANETGPAGYHCADCPATFGGTGGTSATAAGRCVSETGLARRLRETLRDATTLSDDLRHARGNAPAGHKAWFRTLANHAETAVRALEKAAAYNERHPRGTDHGR